MYKQGLSATENDVPSTSPSFERQQAEDNLSLLANEGHTSTSAPSSIQAWLRRAMTMARKGVLNTWWLETLALCFSASCLVATAMILSVFDNSPFRRMPRGLSLNSIIAVLAAASKSSLIFAVTTTMSQCKWCWLKSSNARQKRLGDLQELEDAARGPLGSVVILFNHTLQSLCYLGAIIIILCLVYEPFIQQVVSYPSGQMNTTSQDAVTGQVIGMNIFSALSTKGLVTSAVYSSSSPPHSAHCPTGNCTWEPFWSVGWCSTCEPVPLESDDCNFTLLDIFGQSENISQTCHFAFPQQPKLEVEYRYTIEDGLSTNFKPLWTLNDTPNVGELLRQSEYFSGNNTFLGATNPLLAFGYVDTMFKPGVDDYTTWKQIPQPRLISSSRCVLSPCSKRYNVSVTNGVTTVKTVEEDYGVLYQDATTNKYPGVLCWRPSSSHLNDINYKQLAEAFTILLDRINRAWCIWAQTLATELLAALEGNITISIPRTDGPMNMVPRHNYSGATVYGIKALGISKSMSRVAEILTFDNKNATVLSSWQVNPVYGMVFTEKTFVSVRWLWLLFPIALHVMAIVFLMLVAKHSYLHRIPLWKSSAFAALYHGFEDGVDRTSKLYGTASEMEDAARATFVTLDRSGDTEGHLVLRSWKEK